MLILVHASPTTLAGHRHPNLGVLSSPDRWYRDVEGWPWAADNGAFGEFDPDAYVAMLDGLALLPTRPLFVTVPDVVGDADATLTLFHQWWCEVSVRGLPVALVAQDGLEPGDPRVPWDAIDALFIGGTTEYKLGEGAAELVREAHGRGKHVHWGRVNSLKRFRYVQSIGADSCDGNTHNRFRDIYLDRHLTAAAAPAQGRLVP